MEISLAGPITPPAKRARCRWADIVDDSDYEDICDGPLPLNPCAEGCDSKPVHGDSAGASGEAVPSIVFAPTPSPERTWSQLHNDFGVNIASVPTQPRIYGFMPVVLFGDCAAEPTADRTRNVEHVMASVHDIMVPTQQRQSPCNGAQTPSKTAVKRPYESSLTTRPRSQKEYGVNVCEDEWKTRLQKRCAAVQIVKTSPEYVYLAARRKKGHLTSRMPRTPSPNHRRMSKRDWESVTMHWRVALRQCYKMECGDNS